MTQEQLRMQMLAGIITEGQYKEKLEEWGGGNSENDRREFERSRERDRRESETPKDTWGNDINGYINYLLGLSGVRWGEIDGEEELIDISGVDYADDHFDEYDDKDSYAYKHAKGRGYLDWMFMVRDRYNELKKSGKLKNL